MHTQQRPLPYLYNTSPYTIPAYGTVSSQKALLNLNWYYSWPRVRPIIISVTMIIISMAIIGLDIANLAIEGNKSSGSTTLGSSVTTIGAGIWTGSICLIAAGLVIVTVFVRNKRIAATFALIAVTLAFLFIIVLIGLSGNAVQNNLHKTNLTDAETIQEKLMIAILSNAVFILILCLTFFIMYASMFFYSS